MLLQGLYRQQREKQKKVSVADTVLVHSVER